MVSFFITDKCWPISWHTLLLCMALTSCSLGGDSSGGVAGVSSFDGHQIRKEKVLMDFDANPRKARENYYEDWVKGRALRDRDTSVQSVVVWLAVAGALIKVDSEHYDEYYRYIIFNTESRDWEVASSAVTALSGARGVDSIDRIVLLIRDPRELVSADAVLAIQYRINTAIYDPELKSEYDYSISRLMEVCRSAPDLRGLDQVCRENKLRE